MAVAGSTHTVVIGGKGYQLAESGWECWLEGAAVKEGRVALQGFLGALAVDHRAGRFFESVGLLGYRGGRAGLAPALSLRSGPGVSAPLAACGSHSGSLYLGFGTGVYRVNVVASGPDAGKFAGLSAVKTDFPADVAALASFGGYLYAGLRGANAWRWDGSAWSALSVPSTAWAVWMGFLVGADGRQLRYSADGASWRVLALGQEVLALLPFGGALLAATPSGLLALRGRTTGGGRSLDVQAVPLVATADMGAYPAGPGSFSRLAEFRGRVFFWAGRRLYATDGNRLEALELEGQFGDLATAGSFLFAVVDDSLWAWNDEGFWELARGYTLGRIFSGGGLVRDGGLVVGDRSSSALRLLWLPEGSLYAPDPVPSGYLVSSVIDGGLPGRVKHWQELSVQFGTLGSYPLAQGNGVALSVSLDLGNTWTQVASLADLPSDGYLRASLRGMRSRTLVWKASLSGASYSQPMLRSAAVEYLCTEEGRRRWRLKVLAKDGLAGLDGRPLPTATEILADLMALPQAGAVSYQDVSGQSFTVVARQVHPRMSVVSGGMPQGVVEVELEEVG
jgi:hypothetical protein